MLSGYVYRRCDTMNCQVVVGDNYHALVHGCFLKSRPGAHDNGVEATGVVGRIVCMPALTRNRVSARGIG